MKKAMIAVLAGMVLASSAATAAQNDDKLGCTIALCMANPNGPTAVQECLAPIKKRAELIAKGKPVPKCPGASSGSSGGGNSGGGGRDSDGPVVRQQQK